MRRPKLLFVVNDAPFFISHRLVLAIAARDAGYEVAVACPAHPCTDRFAKEGLGYWELPMPRKRGHLGRELAAAWRLFAILRGFRPNLAHLITAKPVIVGGIFCRILGVPVLAAISGLGHMFIEEDAKTRAVRRIILWGYRLALKRRRALVIFQNPHNREIFERAGIVGQRAVTIRGSGADLTQFDPSPSGNDVPVVALPARMLWTKGVGEFVEAAKILLMAGVRARFILAGDTDAGNPASIDVAQLRLWNETGAVEWIGYRADIATFLRESDIVVLPSYLEGLPKTIVDAAAAGRATVTTDVPGCRDAIVDQETGLLARVRDSDDLAAKIALLLGDPARCRAMGRAARAFAEREFAIERIVEQHLDCYARLLDAPRDHSK
jgi:glycosyltransferase involved in cell wall biosynthesis